MSVLVLVLDGVLQSWGTTTIGHARTTNTYPTKSAIVGMIANALGREREDDIQDIAEISYAVRVDSPGDLQRDYHLVSILTQPSKGDRVGRITERFYLADAVFTIAISHHNPSFLQDISNALNKPSRALFLGRKSCPPSRPVVYGNVEGDIDNALNNIAWQANQASQDAYTYQYVTLDVFKEPSSEYEGMNADVLLDEPLSFNHRARRYASRGIFRDKVTLKVSDNAPARMSTITPAMHLAMQAEKG